jgi:hypothetical protein
MPMYVIMPVNSTLYNDALQQLMFLYTVDYKPWQIAEGRIVHIPIDGVVSITFSMSKHRAGSNGSTNASIDILRDR